MSPVDWAVRPFKRYAMFSGRAPRAEYWWYRLTVGVVGVVIGVVDVLVLHGRIYGHFGALGMAFAAVCALPSIAVLVRRLHDVDRSGWWATIQIPSYSLAIAGKSPFDAVPLWKTLPTGVSIAAVLMLIVAVFVLLIFLVMPGSEGPNRFGPDPYGPDQLEEVFA